MTNAEKLKKQVADATIDELARLIWHQCTRCAWAHCNSYGEGKCPNCTTGNTEWLLSEVEE